jgi:hypothetical protein
LGTLEPLLAEVEQATDITILAFVLAVAFLIGLAITGIDAVVGRIHRKRGRPTD